MLIIHFNSVILRHILTSPRHRSVIGPSDSVKGPKTPLTDSVVLRAQTPWGDQLRHSSAKKLNDFTESQNLHGIEISVKTLA